MGLVGFRWSESNPAITCQNFVPGTTRARPAGTHLREKRPTGAGEKRANVEKESISYLVIYPGTKHQGPPIRASPATLYRPIVFLHQLSTKDKKRSWHHGTLKNKSKVTQVASPTATTSPGETTTMAPFRKSCTRLDGQFAAVERGALSKKKQ